MAEEKVLRVCGMDEGTIEQLRLWDRAMLNSDRRFYEKLQDTGTYLDCAATSETPTEIYTVEDLLNDIDNAELLKALLTVDKLTLQIVVEADALPATAAHPQIALWQGDITRLRADAIVNAANSALLGCFCPCHGCIDNAIHSAAGLQLREECNQIMEAQGHLEPTGGAKLTKGYNLPARYVLHTVGPIVQDEATERDREKLASCYRSCLELAAEHGLETVAFCCISTGEFHFPNREAAEIAVSTVKQFLQTPTSVRKVIFNVFKDIDAELYRDLLGENGTAEGSP